MPFLRNSYIKYPIIRILLFKKKFYICPHFVVYAQKQQQYTHKEFWNSIVLIKGGNEVDSSNDIIANKCIMITNVVWKDSQHVTGFFIE